MEEREENTEQLRMPLDDTDSRLGNGKDKRIRYSSTFADEVLGELHISVDRSWQSIYLRYGIENAVDFDLNLQG